MHREGHVGAALGTYAPIGFAMLRLGHARLALLGAAVAVGLSTLPDVDHHVPGVSHRGYSHTVWFVVTVAGLTGAAGFAYGVAVGAVAAVWIGAFGFVVGATAIGSHIAADALTPMGVRPFAPFQTGRCTYNVTRADNSIANYLLLAGGAALAAAALVLGTATAIGPG